MHDLVLLFKYETGTVTSNFGRFIHTATRHYRTRNFHQVNFDLLLRHNQEYYCNSYFPRTVKLWNSLPNILKSSQDLLWFRVYLYEHFRGLLQVWENEKCCGNTSRRRVFPQLFRVLPNFYECLYNSIETRSTCFLFLLENTTTRKRQTTC